MTSDTDVPPLWFRLPPGFHDIGPGDRTALDTMADALNSPDARRQLGQLMDGLRELAGHQVVHTAIGLHPDEATGVATSLFSLTARPSVDSHPRLNVARAALAITRSGVWSSSTSRAIDLPSSLPCCLISGTITLPETGQEMFQARVATAHACAPHVLVLDLTSAATHHAEAYGDILEAITHTLTFSDPTPSSSSGPRTSRILEVLS
ncbi:hypothetical protein OG914_18490 [Streptomyces sp. NBC_00291]|uniref:hypothetical protein n=2 Tax=unclassified Streptomyces TaxID=2593676 RepID=UPI0022555948|nr:hypothetical protein [Streptomyces sp. NBC_00291]MCX5155974.1 hypothetical protein [Streptomyces sp. NBC_00291]